MAKTAADLMIKLSANSAELKKGLDKANSQLSNFQKGMNSIASTFKSMFAIGAVVAMGSKLMEVGREASNLAAKGEGVRIAFAKLPQSTQLLEDMRTATKGTISDLKLMEKSMMAKEFGIDIQKMPSILAFASVQAQKLGKDIDYLAESAVTGLARESKMILDNLGISSVALNEKMAEGFSLQDAALEIMNERLLETGGLMETTAVRQSQWSAEVENTKEQFGILINKGLNAIIPVILELWSNIKEFFRTTTKDLVEFINGWITLYNESMEFRHIVESIKVTFNLLWQTVKLVLSSMIDSIQSVGRVLAYVFNPSNWGKDFASGLKEVVTKNMDDMNENFFRFGKSIKDSFTDGIKNVKDGYRELLKFDDAEVVGKEIGEETKDGIEKGFKQDPVKMQDIVAFDTKVFDTYQDQMYDALKGTEIPDLGLEDDSRYLKEMQDSMAEISEYYQSLSSFGFVSSTVNDGFSAMQNGANSLIDLMGDLYGEDSRTQMADFLEDFLTITSVVQNFVSVLESLNQVLQFFNTIGTISNSIIAAITVNKRKETAASLGNAAASRTEATADGIGAAAKAGKSVAGIPIVGAVLAVAAIAGVLAALASLVGFSFADGGIVGGNSYSGDNLIARVNSGEMVLNSAQQANLFKMINSGQLSGGNVVFTIEGDKLEGVMENYAIKQITI